MAIGDWLVKRIKDLVRTATSSDLTDGEFVAVDKTDGYTRKMTVASLATWVLGKIKSLATTITTFRDGDVIPVDGSQGTAKMTAVSLSSWIHGRWAAFVDALTAKTSFASGDKIPVVNGNTASAMEADDLLRTTSQNALAGNVAPLFDPNKPNDAGGYAYYAGNNVTYDGQNFVFIANHKAGAWNPLEVEHKPLSESINLQGVGEAVDEWLNNHPEATTTVPDNSLTKDKFTDLLRQETLNDYVTPEMFGAVGDGTADDTTAMQACLDYAFANNKSVYLGKSYRITDSLDVHGWCVIRGSGGIHTRTSNRFNIIFVPSNPSSMDSPTELFVNRGAGGAYHHTFINVSIRRASGTCACFGRTCPIDNNSVVYGCYIHQFSIVFNTSILHCSWVVRNKFSSVMQIFVNGNVADSYILNNEITGYRPFAPICFTDYVTFSEVADNFFDFWFGVFTQLNNSRVANNEFDFCFWTFGYAKAFGTKQTLIRGTITGNIFTNCSSCHTSSSGFGSVLSDIRISLYGEFKVKVLTQLFPCSFFLAHVNYNEETDVATLAAYYNTLEGTIVGNKFDGSGLAITGIVSKCFMEGNSYAFSGTTTVEAHERIFFNTARDSTVETFNRHYQSRLDIFEYVQFGIKPNEFMTNPRYGEMNFRIEGCPVYYNNVRYVCRWSSDANRFVFYDDMGNLLT